MLLSSWVAATNYIAFTCYSALHGFLVAGTFCSLALSLAAAYHHICVLYLLATRSLPGSCQVLHEVPGYL